MATILPCLLIATELSGTRVISQLLSHDFELVFVKDISNALQQAKFKKPDLIFCDLVFDSSGVFELLNRVREIPSLAGVPFVCGPVQSSGMQDSLISSFELICKGRKDCIFLDILKLRRSNAEEQIVRAFKNVLEDPFSFESAQNVSSPNGH